MTHYQVGIVGTGPSGLGCAYALMVAVPDFVRRKNSVILYDEKNVTSGGLANDCKMNLTPDIGPDQAIVEAQGRDRIEELVQLWDEWCMRHGDPLPSSGENLDAILDWQHKLKRYCDIDLVTRTKQRHYGTDGASKIIKGIKKELQAAGVTYALGTQIKDVTKSQRAKRFTYKKMGGNDYCDVAVLGPGRIVNDFLQRIFDRFDIASVMNPVEAGVRLEMRTEGLLGLPDVVRDAKMKALVHGDYLKTFCMNPNGMLILDNGDTIKVNGEHYQMVNGHGLRDLKSQVTNVAILEKISLTNPLGDTAEYGRNMARAAFIATNGKVMVQRMGDFYAYPDRCGRSHNEDFPAGHWKDHPPLEVCTLSRDKIQPGSMSIWMNERHADRIRGFLDRLANLFPEVKNPKNILAGPEVKFQNTRVDCDPVTLETKVDNLYVIGNGAGTSSGIVAAAVDGMIAGFAIAERLSK